MKADLTAGKSFPLGPTVMPGGVRLNQPDWSDSSHSIAFSVRSLLRSFMFHCMINAYWEPLTFELPRDEAGMG